MRSLIKLLFVLLICLIGIGFYRGWFTTVQPENIDPKGNKVNVNMSVDEGKMKSDVKRAKQKVKEEIRELEGKGKDNQSRPTGVVN